jgi:predicted nucleic acid-binding protein
VKVYLDTSVISALFDERNPERKNLTEGFFQKMHHYHVYISELTLLEIERTPDSALRSKMRKSIAVFNILPIDDRIEDIVKQYIHYDAIPQSYREDAYHIAVAAINEMDYLLSWNYRHIVRRKTRDIVHMVNTLNNLKPIEILTPGELL